MNVTFFIIEMTVTTWVEVSHCFLSVFVTNFIIKVGSFEKDNKTLYVGQLGLAGGLEDVVYKHFVEWGEIEYRTLELLMYI